jgi:hypothetical protein
LLGYACVPHERIGPVFDALAAVIDRQIQAAGRAVRTA